MSEETKTVNSWIESKAVSSGEIDGHKYWICKHPMMDRGLGGFNGYVLFPKRPVKEPAYGGILTYVPVHGGITYAEEDGDGIVYGFDTGHCDSESYPIRETEWIKGQCKIMLAAIKRAAELEDKYLLACGDNEARAEIADEIGDIQPGQKMNTMAILNALSGRL